MGRGEAIDLCEVLWCCLVRKLLNAVLSFLSIRCIQVHYLISCFFLAVLCLVCLFGLG